MFTILIKKFQSSGGAIAMQGLVNSFVHAVMYAYYLISSLSINKTTIAALKKPVTQLQLVSSSNFLTET